MHIAERIRPYHVAFYAQVGSPYVRPVSKVLDKLKEAGISNKILDDALVKKSRYFVFEFKMLFCGRYILCCLFIWYEKERETGISSSYNRNIISTVFSSSSNNNNSCSSSSYNSTKQQEQQVPTTKKRQQRQL